MKARHALLFEAAEKSGAQAAAAPAAQDTAKAAKADAMVYFTVEENGAVIGEFHHAKGKVLELPESAAEAAVKQKLGKITGVVIPKEA